MGGERSVASRRSFDSADSAQDDGWGVRMTEGTEEEEYRFAFVVALLLVVRFWGVTYNFDLSDVRFWSAYEWL
jgi:hypothetical protein